MASPEGSLFDSLPPREPGLISLMYWVTHNPYHKKAFHDDESSGLRFFDIRPQRARDLIVEIGKDRTAPAARTMAQELFEAYLIDELFGIWRAETRAAALPPEEVPRGLISFMYWVKHDRFFNRFLLGDQDLSETAHQFGLSEGARALLLEIHRDPDAPSARNVAKTLFEDHLIDEVLRVRPKPTFW